MRALLKLFAVLLIALGALAAAGFAYVRATGLSARPGPAPFEAWLARALRSAAIPAADREQASPIPASPEAIADGLAHFADHCAVCHGNDGSGDTPFGRGLFPRPPDLRAAATQELTDGELFYVIENGVRFTGMPAFGSGDGGSAEGTWHLVLFIRELPRLTAEQLERMELLNPKPPAQDGAGADHAHPPNTAPHAH
jgi:mono/diheme cytochrome c family protein